MPISNERRPIHVSLDLEPELQYKMERAAAEQHLSIEDYVQSIVRRVLSEEDYTADAIDEGTWSHLSTRSFARDWISDEDQVYDQLS